MKLQKIVLLGQILNNNMEFDVPYLDPAKTYEDYVASTAQGTIRDMNKNDNIKRHPQTLGAMTFNLISSHSSFPNLRVVCLSIGATNNANRRKHNVRSFSRK